ERVFDDHRDRCNCRERREYHVDQQHRECTANCFANRPAMDPRSSVSTQSPGDGGNGNIQIDQQKVRGVVGRSMG
ncbi:MAG: hypothetical protein ABGY24_06125, partial [bacterium]